MLEEITIGHVYRYTCRLPIFDASGRQYSCHGCLYRCHRTIITVPSYQTQLLMEALDGPDAGLWFCCSPANFLTRYEPVEESPPAEAKTIVMSGHDNGK